MYLTFVGCLLTAYGPLAALFVGHVASSAQHVILVISRCVCHTYLAPNGP